MKISVMQQLYTLQEKDSSLKKDYSCRLKISWKKITDSALKIYYKQQGKFKDRYSHSYYEVSILTTPEMDYKLPQMSRQSREQFKH